MGRRAVLISVVILVAAIGLLPLAAMFARSLVVDGHLSAAYYQELWSSGRQWILIRNSFVLASLATLLATAVGLPLGILLARTDLPLRRLFAVLFTVPLVAPPYITAVSWFDVLGREGLLSRFLGRSAAAWTSDRLFSLPGCVLVLGSTFLPVSMLLAITYLQTVNPRLEEAARLVSGWAGVLRRITVPLILPGVLLGGTLVFLLALGEFGVPIFLRYDVFPVESFTQFSAFFNFSAAAAAAAPLGAATLLILGLEWFILRDRMHPLQPAPVGGPPARIPLGPLRWSLFLLVALFCSLIVLLPFSGLLIRSFSSVVYSQALSKAGDSLVRSVTYAALGASLLTLLGWFLGYLVHTKVLAWWRGADALTLLLFAMPGTVIGIGMVNVWNRPETALIYGTPAIILLGYLAQYTALTSRITASTLAQIPRSMEESAQVAGAGWLRRTSRILVPLARRGLIAGWLVAYIFCLRDLGISMMVYPPGRDTFPVRTFTLMANSPPELIAALCVIMMVATLVPLGFLGVVFKQDGAAGGVH